MSKIAKIKNLGIFTSHAALGRCSIIDLLGNRFYWFVKCRLIILLEIHLLFLLFLAGDVALLSRDVQSESSMSRMIITMGMKAPRK